MWGKRIQETISERPEEEDCESYDRNNNSYEKAGTNKRTLTKIETIINAERSDNNELNFLKKKSSLSKLRNEIEKSSFYMETDIKSTKVESAERNSKDKVKIL
jgi:hypothetical protein